MSIQKRNPNRSLQVLIISVVLAFSLIAFLLIYIISFNKTRIEKRYSTSNSYLSLTDNSYKKFINAIPLEKGSKNGWKKYTNIKQGYSIEFPDSYTTDVGIANQLNLYPLYDKDLDKPTGTISISGPDNTSSRGDIESLTSYITDGQNMDSGIGNVIWTKINGYEVAIERDYRYYYFNRGHIYYIDKRINPTLEKEFNEILNTFIFLN